MDDNDLVRDYLNGDKNALGVLYKKYYSLLLQEACSILKDRFEAEDVVNDCFIRAERGLERYISVEPQKFRPWICTILYNSCINILRDKRRRRFLIERYNFQGLGGDFETPLDYVVKQDFLDLLEEGLKNIKNPNQVDAVRMQLNGSSYKEIAETFDVSLGTVMSRIYRGKKSLKEYFSPYEETSSL